VIRRQAALELVLLRATWSVYRSEAAPLARALLVVIALTGAYSFLALPFVVRGGHLSRLAEDVAFVVMAAVLVGPLSGGLIGMLLAHVRVGRRGRARDVFLGYRRFIPLAVAGVLGECALDLRHAGSWHVHVALRLVAIVVGIGLGLLLIYLVPTIIDQGRSLRSSLAAALGLLRPPELWRTLVAAAVIGAASLLVEQPANLLVHRSFGLATMYLLVAILAWVPFVLSYFVNMYERASPLPSGRP